MNRYNILKQIKLYTFWGGLLFNLCFVETLIAQNQETMKVKPKKTQPDGIPGPPKDFHLLGFNGRDLIKAPRIEDNSDISGRIVMAICVNKKGKVVSAKVVPTKSTISDAALIQKVTQAVKGYRYSRAKKKGEDCGEINFRFIVQ